MQPSGRYAWMCLLLSVLGACSSEKEPLGVRVPYVRKRYARRRLCRTVLRPGDTPPGEEHRQSPAVI